MPFKNPPNGYSLFSRFLHWFTAFVIIGILALGLYMEDLDPSPFMFKLYALHKSLGVLVLGLFFIRIVWRFASAVPPILGNPTKHQKMMASAAHILLLLCMFIMPISGWLMSSTAGYPVSFFKLFTLPDLTGKNHDLHEFLEEVHEITANGLIILIVLHAGAALYHHFIKKDGTLKRMTSG